MATPQPVDGARMPAYRVPPWDPAIWLQWAEELRERGRLRPRIVLHGGYGKRNLGDDAILEVLLSRVQEAFPTARVTVVCHGPAEVHARHQVDAYHFTSWQTLKAILQADVYIIGGGGIVNRINTYSGFRRLRVLDPKGKFLFVAAALAKLCGARVDFHTIGATSFPDPVVRWLARFVINRSDALTVRDQRSQDILRSAGVRGRIPVVLDPVTQLEPASPEWARQRLTKEGVYLDRLKVGINFRYVAEPDIDNAYIVREVARLVRDLLDKYNNSQIIFLPFGRHPTKEVENDLAFARQVANRLQHQRRFHVLEGECSPAEMKALLGQMDLCILERLHAVILAAPMGVPIVSVIYDHKVAAFADMAGLGDNQIPLRQFSFESARKKIDSILAKGV
jgi:polysaccharide pyruvyl transferase CsaB